MNTEMAKSKMIDRTRCSKYFKIGIALCVTQLENIDNEGEIHCCRSVQIKFDLIWYNLCNIKYTLNQIIAVYAEQFKWIDFTAG